MTATEQVQLDHAQGAAEAALTAHGASAAHAAATARSLVRAEAEGNLGVGLAHLVDYCEALSAGRADGTADPSIERPTEIVTRIDARQGFPHLGVERAWDAFAAAARRSGVAVLALRNGYTCGALGYFVRRLAEEHGLAGLAAANGGPAMLPAAGGTQPVYCTNPLAFAMPSARGETILIDQSSSATAYVKIRAAETAGETIPEGWALDASGAPTTDPAAALAGTLLPFGGHRGANIALIVELLAAGLTGGTWSHLAPPFNEGDASPGVGLLIIALDPATTGGEAAGQRVDELIQRLGREPAAHIPGAGKQRRTDEASREGLEIDRALWARIVALGA